MKNRKRKQKALMLSLGLALGVLIPKVDYAQSGGGMLGYGPETEQQSRGNLLRNGIYQGGFNIGTEIFGSDTDGGFNIYTQQFGDEAPLGGGWLVLTMAGTAYAFKKRKNDNKK